MGIAGGTILVAAGTYYLCSDKSNFTRNDIKTDASNASRLLPDEVQILYLASLAPSGHNTQPWFVQYVEPYHWIIGNDKSKWLPAVDPTQRETILSIGAFLQTLEYAAGSLGYACQFNLLATTNQAQHIAEVTLSKAGNATGYEIQKIKRRRTVRSHYLNDVLTKADQDYLIREASNFFQYIPNTAKEHSWLNEQTIEANRVQSYRDAAQKELADWIRFSSKDAERYADGLTTGSMEITGVPAWVLRNYYGKADVMKNGFREQSIDKVRDQVAKSAGWLLITGNGDSVGTLLETGKRMQRLFLKVRERSIAIHPMTQILEEPATNQQLNASIGIADTVQFILRIGYVKNYPEPVSLRRPVERFIRT